MMPMERGVRMTKNRLREPLRLAEPIVKALLAFGPQGNYKWFGLSLKHIYEPTRLLNHSITVITLTNLDLLSFYT